MRSRVCESLTQISLYEGIEPHTDPTDPTEFARLMLNLTDTLRTFASSGSHRSHRSHWFFLMALNLTDALRRLAPKAHTDSTDSTKKRRISVFYKPQISTN